MTIRWSHASRGLGLLAAAATVAVSSLALATPAFAASAPTAPRIGTPWGDGVAINAAVTAPLSDGGSPITQYTFSATDSSGSSPLICTGITTSCLYPDLSPSTRYTYTVTATNAVGTSAASPPVSFTTTNGLPGAPRAQPAGAVTGVSVFANVYVPATTGGKPILDLTVTLQPGDKVCKSLNGCQFTGLTPSTKYSFTAVATNEFGTGPASAPISFTTTNGLPEAPSGPTASYIDTTVANVGTFYYWYMNGGSPITAFAFTLQPGGTTCTNTVQSCQFTGLSPFTIYTVTATATNAIGTSPASTIGTFRTLGALPSVTAVAPTNVTRTSATLLWNDNMLYTSAKTLSVVATVSPGGQTCTLSLQSCIVNGLTPDTPYTFSVKATNASGTTTSNAVAFRTTLGLPTSPNARPAVSIGTDVASATWTYGYDGGYAITSSTVTLVDPSGVLAPKSCTTFALRCAFGGLNPGSTYTYTVTVTNVFGTSPVSNVRTFKTLGAAPIAPMAPSPNGAAATTPIGATLTWRAPANNGGSVITGYTATVTPGGQSCTTAGTVLSCTIGGFAPNTLYTYTVTATNAIGTSPASAGGSFQTARGMPTPPTAVAPTNMTASSADATWTAPSDDWGSPITMYTVTFVDITPVDDLPRICTTVGAARSCTFYNLVAGDTYTYTVTATNGYGLSQASNPITFVVPAV